MKQSTFCSGYIEITTFEGSKYIKDLKVGDLVLTHLKRYKQITQINKRILYPTFSQGIFDIYFFSENQEKEKGYEIDGIHRISGDSVLYINGCLKRVIDVKIGDILQLRKDQKGKVAQIMEIPSENYGDWLYSIEVEKDHSYYADDGLIKD